MKDYKKILTDFYAKHNPGKISEVTDLLNKYEGQEEELLTNLYKKYNVNEFVDDNSGEKEDYKKLLTDFYSKHNPEKISEVSGLLEKYKGQEEELLNKLYEKYNVNQKPPIQEEYLEIKSVKPKEPEQQKAVQENSYTNSTLNTVKKDIQKTSKINTKLFVIIGLSVLIITITVVGVKLLFFNQATSCDQFLTGYESYVNKVIEIKNKIEQNPNDLTFVSEYNNLQADAFKWTQIPESCQKDQEFMVKYIDFQSKLPTTIINESQKSLDSGISTEKQENLPDTTKRGEVNYLYKADANGEGDIQLKVYEDDTFELYFKNFEGEYEVTYLGTVVLSSKFLRLTFGDNKPELSAFFDENYDRNNGFQVLNDNEVEIDLTVDPVYLWGVTCTRQIFDQQIGQDNILSPSIYIVSSEKAYFHNEPDDSTQRKGYLIAGQQFLGKEIKNGFVYAEYTNTQGIMTNVWLKISDVRKD